MTQGKRRYTEQEKADIVDRLCMLVADGNTLTAACKEVGVSRLTVYAWRQQDASITKRLDIAWDQCLEVMADEVIEIIDKTHPGQIVTVEAGKNGKPTKTTTKISDMIEHRKLRAWGRLQLLSRISTRYGRRTVLAGDPKNPITNLNARTDYSDEQLLYLIEHGKLPDEPTEDPSP